MKGLHRGEVHERGLTEVQLHFLHGNGKGGALDAGSRQPSAAANYVGMLGRADVGPMSNATSLMQDIQQ